MKNEIYIYLEETLNIGEENIFESFFEESDFGVVFEDDGMTGYFYAVLKSEDSIKILNSLHIYDVKDVIDKSIPSKIKILWNDNLTKSFLSINNYYHAIFDFDNKKGYNRNHFPKSSSDWKNEELTDLVLNKIAEN